MATLEHMREILNTQEGRTITVLSSLITIQNALRYLPPEAFPAVAEFTGSSTNEAYGVATFYTHFRLTPPTKNTIEVCWGPTCHLLGARKVAEAFQALEGRVEVTFRRNSCLAACAQGPVALVNEELMGRLTLENVQALVAKLQGDW